MYGVVVFSTYCESRCAKMRSRTRDQKHGARKRFLHFTIYAYACCVAKLT